MQWIFSLKKINSEYCFEKCHDNKKKQAISSRIRKRFWLNYIYHTLCVKL